MSFRINEAPEMVLDAINNEKKNRGCGLFWTFACLLPTLGATIWCRDSNEHTKSCCFPKNVSIKSDCALDSLIFALKTKVKKSYEEIQQGKKLNNNYESEMAIQQANATLALLTNVIKKQTIEGSYLYALQKVHDKINATLNADKDNSEVLENIPLVSRSVNFG